MIRTKMKFKASVSPRKPGVLFYQISFRKKTFDIRSGYQVFNTEWDENRQCIIIPESRSGRFDYLKSVCLDMDRVQHQMVSLLESLTSLEVELTLTQFVRFCNDGAKSNNSVFGFLTKKIEMLHRQGRERTSEIWQTTLQSFRHFRNGLDLYFPFLDRFLIEEYEIYLKNKGLSRNTTSFYMRVLRTAYHAAVEEGLTENKTPFRKVYTGIDKTVKRAVGIEDIKRIRSLDLSSQPALEYSRDLFLFSFYMRGMSFVDMAYLQKTDLNNGYLSYRRKKTGQLLTIKWTRQMQEIVNRHTSDSAYLLPIIRKYDGTERHQYLCQLIKINRLLKRVGELADLNISLSTYVSRHAWASIAREKNIPLAVISEGLGHNNELTTQIYLDSIKNTEIDKANQLILGELI